LFQKKSMKHKLCEDHLLQKNPWNKLMWTWFVIEKFMRQNYMRPRNQYLY
jgi:hypothetical protein